MAEKLVLPYENVSVRILHIEDDHFQRWSMDAVVGMIREKNPQVELVLNVAETAAEGVARAKELDEIDLVQFSHRVADYCTWEMPPTMEEADIMRKKADPHQNTGLPW